MPVDQLIYTDLARGKGMDPNLKGYQVKACSAGLSEIERDQLGALALHFRTSVYENAPKAAHDREQAWRVQTETLDAVPEDVLKEFPHVWSYAKLGEDRFALTRVRYLGFTHDQRPGNFFAHALVFAPDDLAPHRSNPLALSRSNLFLSSDPSDRTALPPLPGLAGPDAATDLRLLRGDPYRGCLAALVDAICRAPAPGRPVLICLDDWRKSAPLVEALLSLLPPAARRRTTFCTMEHDRRWAGPGASTAGQSAAHNVMVLCPKDGRSLEIWPNEYDKTMAIFNFAEDKNSPLEEPGEYARFAAKCASSDAGMARLQEHHELIQKLDCALDRAAWDELVAVVGALSLPPAALKNAVRALCKVAQKPKQAQTALDLLLPAFQALAQSGQGEELNILTADMAPLVDRAPGDCSFVQRMRGEAVKAFSAGNGMIAASFLQACGKARDEALTDALRAPAQTVSKADRDCNAMVDLRLDGLRLFTPDGQMLLSLFDAAQSAGRTAEVWKVAGEGAVQTYLTGDLPADQRIRFLRDLADRVPMKLDPDAAVWLRLQLLTATNPAGEPLLQELEALAAASAGCSGAHKVGASILERVEKLDGLPRAVALGRLAEAGRESSLAEKLFAEYRDALKAVAPQQQVEARRQLAGRGVLKVLCREFLADASMADSDASRQRLISWREKILTSNEKLMNEVRAGLAERLRSSEDALCVAEELLSEPRSGDGFILLFEAVVRSLPFEPLRNDWRKKLLPPPEKVPERARSRLQVLEFLAKLRQESDKDTWCIERFSSASPPWKEARQLEFEDRKRLRDLCLDSIADTGIATPEQAPAFLSMLGLGEDQPGPEAVADAVERLLRNRDDVTRVEVAAAFARCALEGDKTKNWGQFVNAIVRRFDRDTRRLFEAHLKGRFHKPSRKYDDQLRHLCEEVGLSAPVPQSPAAPARQDGAVPAPSAGVFGKAKNAFRKLLGDSGSDRNPDEK